MHALCGCILRRAADTTARFSAKNRSDALFQVIKYASRGERVASQYHRRSDGSSGQVLQQEGDVAPPSMWCTALAALSIADRLGCLENMPSSMTSHVITCLPQPHLATSPDCGYESDGDGMGANDGEEVQRDDDQARQQKQQQMQRNTDVIQWLLIHAVRRAESQGGERAAHSAMAAVLTPLVIRRVLQVSDWKASLGLLLKYQPVTTLDTVQQLQHGDPALIITAMDMLDVLQRQGHHHPMI
mmetsp:Transcript_65475/g.76169  ORF Transcript_65475/g.76169 Transcript_65475/m.76169 type:complete len:243 (+) Transcript_65475:130-858(+)